MTENNNQLHKEKLCGVQLTCLSLGDVLKGIETGVENRQCQYISITNTESVYHATKIKDHADYINGATFSCCDGVGVVLAGKMLGCDIPRLHGPDLMVACCEYGVSRGWRHFFYGGKEGVPEMLSEKLRAKFPGLITVCSYSPPFRELSESEDNEIIEMINKARPDFLWVGLGLLKQERWIASHLNKVDVPWMVGVGAAFDFFAGTVKRAPIFYQKIGLEWLYRLLREPRMLKRNASSFLLLFIAAKERIRLSVERMMSHGK